MTKSNLTIALYLLLVFCSGVAVGGFGYHVYAGTPVSAKAGAKMSPEEWRRQYISEMQTRVKLTAAQSQEVNSILDETRSLFHESREKHNRELDALRLAQANKIRAILTDEQRPEYEKLRAEREQRAKAAKK
jgi:Spy/CpxP family protein refolding chaperone